MSKLEHPYTVRWCKHDSAWLGECEAFPLLCYRADTSEQALDGIMDLVEQRVKVEEAIHASKVLKETRDRYLALKQRCKEKLKKERGY